MSDREDELLDQRHEAVMTAISGVHTRLDILNGRTRKLEQKVSVLSWAYGVATAAAAYVAAWVTGKS